MSYNVETTPQADEEFSRLPKPIRDAAIRQFIDFAKNPGVGGTKSSPALYAPGQLFEMQMSYDQLTCWVGIVFKYASNEQTLVIQRVYCEFV